MKSSEKYVNFDFKPMFQMSNIFFLQNCCSIREKCFVWLMVLFLPVSARIDVDFVNFRNKTFNG